MLKIVLTVVINMLMLLFPQVLHVMFCLTLIFTYLEASDLDDPPVIINATEFNVTISEMALRDYVLQKVKRS